MVLQLMLIESKSKGVTNMTQSKHEKERQWNVRKEEQHPHGKVSSFKELSEGKKEKQ